MKAVLRGSVPVGAHSLARWLVHAHASRERLDRSSSIDGSLPPEDRLSQANVLQQLEHIQSYALVAERLTRRELELYGGWFDVERADTYAWRAAEERFIRVDEQFIAQTLAGRAAVSS